MRRIWRGLVLAAAMAAAAKGGASAASPTTLHAFAGNDGFNPQATLHLDAKGNVFGTTASGGGHNRGIVFELTPQSGGTWAFTVVHDFAGAIDGADGLTGVAVNSAGNLIGVTYEGGSYDQGTAFQVAPSTTTPGAWNYGYLLSFGGSNFYGYWPVGGLVAGANRSMFGTTSYGGGNSAGLVFQLSPPVAPGQHWTEQPIYAFLAYGSGDGYSPQAGLYADGKGNIFGTTVSGGANGAGAVFELSPAAGGGWNERVVYSFKTSNDGQQPRGTLIPGPNGVLYGTTSYGGPAGAGTVYELIPSGTGYTEQVVYSFQTNNIGGVGPQGALALDSRGRIYGTTPFGGTAGFGVIFRVTPGSTLPWQEAILHNFSAGLDGATPYGGLVTANSGASFFGATSAGGAGGDGRWGYGTVFEYVP